MKYREMRTSSAISRPAGNAPRSDRAPVAQRASSRASHARPLTPDMLRALQRTHGNAYVQRLLQREHAAAPQPVAASRQSTPDQTAPARSSQRAAPLLMLERLRNPPIRLTARPSRMVIQCARYSWDELPDTNADWTTTKVGKYTLPKRMVARPLSAKSFVNSNEQIQHTALYNDLFSWFNSGVYPDGHLLNHEMGGPDQAPNLVPISSDANTQMNSLEEYVKAVALQRSGTYGVLDYEVAVNYGRSGGDTSAVNAIPTSLDMRVIHQMLDQQQWKDDLSQPVKVLNVRVDLAQTSQKAQKSNQQAKENRKSSDFLKNFLIGSSSSHLFSTDAPEGQETNMGFFPKNEQQRQQVYQDFTKTSDFTTWQQKKLWQIRQHDPYFQFANITSGNLMYPGWLPAPTQTTVTTGGFPGGFNSNQQLSSGSLGIPTTNFPFNMPSPNQQFTIGSQGMLSNPLGSLTSFSQPIFNPHTTTQSTDMDLESDNDLLDKIAGQEDYDLLNSNLHLVRNLLELGHYNAIAHMVDADQSDLDKAMQQADPQQQRLIELVSRLIGKLASRELQLNQVQLFLRSIYGITNVTARHIVDKYNQM